MIDQGKRKIYNIDPFEIIEILGKLIDPDTAYIEILRFITESYNADSGQIIIRDWENDSFVTRIIASTLPEAEQDYSSTILRKVCENKKAKCIPNAVVDPEFSQSESILGKTFLSVIVVPIIEKNELIGALYLDRRYMGKNEFDEKYDLDSLQALANKIAPILKKQAELDQLRRSYTWPVLKEMGVIVGKSEIMRELCRKLEKYSRNNFTLYIYGETGSGKEWMARASHLLGPRKNKPFIVVDCTQLSNETAEVELFGSVKGAFTDATDKIGAFEAANGGTIFLDEIVDLPLDVQAKLLRVLEKGQTDKITIKRKGAEKEISLDVRIVAATNRNLEDLANQGQFRQDLLFRLKQLEICVPPLRTRKEDILPLAEAFLDRITPANKGFTQNAQEALKSNNWKGNVRDLKHSVERAAVNYDCRFPLTAKMLFPKDAVVFNNRQPEKKTEKIAAHSLGSLSTKMKHEVVLETVKRCVSKSEAAKELGIHRQTIHNILNAVDSERATRLLHHHNGDLHRTAEELAITVRSLEKILRNLDYR